MGNLSIKEHLKNEILRTGYPLEVEVTSLLESEKNWMVSNNEYYRDEEENKARSIDIYAFRIPIREIEGKIEAVSPTDPFFNYV